MSGPGPDASTRELLDGFHSEGLSRYSADPAEFAPVAGAPDMAAALVVLPFATLATLQRLATDTGSTVPDMIRTAVESYLQQISEQPDDLTDPRD